LRSFKLTRFWLLIPALVIVSGAAFGSGFGLFEHGAKATAMGGAFAATADDPSAIFYNVAGIAQQRKTRVMAGATIINFSNQFTGDPNDPITAGDAEHYRRHTFVLPNMYVIVPVGQNVTFGLGVFSPFGLRTNWENPSLYRGRFISQDANVKAVDVEPAIARKTSDGRFAIGVGGDYRRSHIQLDRNNGAVNPFTFRFVDVAHAHLNSDWNTAWGYNVGLLAKPSPTWSIGLAYRANMDINYTGTAAFTQISTGNPQLDGLVKAGLPPNQGIKTTIAYPGIATLGIGTTALNGWQLELDGTYTTWSRFKNLDIAFLTTPANNLHRPQNWTNTWSYRIGANKAVNDNWDVRFGGVYDMNPQPTEGVGPLLPDANRVGPSLGIGWHNGHWSFDATEFRLHFLPRNTFGSNLDNFNGVYKTDANLITVDFGYTF
jgi:long-chain fatty acid transport protein